MKDFILGSMYWINPNYTLDELRKDMREITENRITLLRIFILWEYVEVEKGRFDFAIYDRFFKAAEEYDIRVMPTLIFYLPFHRVVEQAAGGRSDIKRRVPCLDRPEIREGLEEFVSKTVCRYKDSPALAIWNLWNEPTDPVCLCSDSLEHFAAWLKRRYRSFDALKEAWAGEYYIFNPILPRSLDDLNADWLEKALTLATRARNTAIRLDWFEFQTDHSAAHVDYLSNLVKKYDAAHPTHTNPALTHCNPVGAGISPWKLAQVQDSISCSIHPHSMFGAFESDPERYPAVILSNIDKARSWGEGGETWIGEYQAGSTLEKYKAYTPRARDISATLFHALARGMHGLIFWQWQSWRGSAFEVGEFSLRNPSDGGPTERSEAAKKFGMFLEQYQPYLRLLGTPRPRAAVLFSFDQLMTENLLVEDNPSTPVKRHTYASWGCHQVLVNAGIPCDFITETQLTEDGRMDQYRVLILPQVRIIAPETAAAIEKFVRNGGAVWADGRCGFLDKHMFLRSTVPGNGLDRVFGCRETDEVAPRAEDLLILKDGSSLKPFREIQRLMPLNSEVIAECSGYPAAVRNRYGKGVAELWGTYLSVNPETDLTSMLCDFAAANGVQPEIKIDRSAKVISSVLHGENILFLVLTSLADHDQLISAQLPIAGGEIINETSAVLNGDMLEYTIASGETLPLLIRIKNR